MSSLRNHRPLFWDFPGFLAHKLRGAEFYVFVEESGPVTPDGLMGPDERPVEMEVARELGKRSLRIRASGIEAVEFQLSMDAFEEIDHDNVGGEQRRQRKDQLNDAFGERPLPIFDLYVGEEDEEYQFLKAVLVPGAWYWIVVKKRSVDDTGPPILVGAPELPAGPYAPGTLAFIETVPLSIEYRLRDIFSLVHITDAEFGAETGGEGEPLPPEPDVEPDEGTWEAPARLYLQSQPMKSSGG